MRKYFYILLLAFITPNIAWGVSKQTYTDPSALPAAFEWNMERFDVCEPTHTPSYRNENHTQKDIVVTWDPTYLNAEGSYGKLYIKNYYTNDTLPAKGDIDFYNIDNRNFQWSEDGTKLYFSFQALPVGEDRVKPFSWTGWKYALFASAGQAGSYEYYAYNKRYNNPSHARNANHGYDGKAEVNFVLDVATKTITTSSKWGVFIGQYAGYSPGSTRVFNFYTQSTFYSTDTDLVDIVNDPEILVGDEVTVDDDLLAVACLERNLPNGDTQKVLFAKDFNKFLNPDVNTRGADDFLARTVGPIADQSNWVALTYDDNPAALLGLQGFVLKGGSIKGTLTDKSNPAITLSALPTEGAEMAYTPNTYIAPSFCDEYASDESPYFFVQPKPQEYCYVMWADYNAATNAFYVPALGAIEGGNGSVSNPENLSGGFGWNDTYLRPGDGPIDRQVFNFNAVVNKISYTDTYNVWVHTLDGSNQLMEDGNTHIYAWKGDGDNKTEYCGAWPGTPLTDKRTDSTGGEWYYYSFGNTCPDGIIFNYPGKKQCVDIVGQLVAGDNFFNYYPEGADGDNRYWNLTGQYSRQQAPRRAQQHDPKVGDLSERYVVMPLQLDVNSVVTAVADVRSQAAVASVRYVDAMGRVSATPHRGINIVVTRHTDGTTSTRKVVM